MQICSTRVVQVLVAGALLISPALLAQGVGSAKAETFEAIQSEFESASKEWMTSYNKARQSGAERAELSKMVAKRPNPSDYVARVKAIVTADAKSADAGAASAWLITRGRVRGADLGFALDVIGRHHMDSGEMGAVMSALSRNPAPAVSRFMAKALKMADGDALANGLMSAGEQLKSAAAMSRTLAAGSDEQNERYIGLYGREVVDVLKSSDADAFEARSAALFERVIKDDALSAAAYRRGTAGEAAERTLFELRNLSVGKVAPDIVGEDVDGTPMKLSDYRGKVVVLDFWGDW
jgi:hypothetical protein